PSTYNEDETAVQTVERVGGEWLKRAAHVGKGWGFYDPAFGETPGNRQDESRLNTEGGLPPHAPKYFTNINIFCGLAIKCFVK
ncbi:MAG: hypothetical protein QW095_06520, partial [Nitrososphaerota archaeon]